VLNRRCACELELRSSRPLQFLSVGAASLTAGCIAGWKRQRSETLRLSLEGATSLTAVAPSIFFGVSHPYILQWRASRPVFFPIRTSPETGRCNPFFPLNTPPSNSPPPANPPAYPSSSGHLPCRNRLPFATGSAPLWASHSVSVSATFSAVAAPLPVLPSLLS
jgi:hypothetical protein